MLASMDGIRHAQRWRVAPWTVGSAEGDAGRRFTSLAVSPGAMWSFAGFSSFPNCSFRPVVRNAVNSSKMRLVFCPDCSHALESPPGVIEAMCRGDTEFRTARGPDRRV